MYGFKQYTALAEHFVNAIGTDDKNLVIKRKYADQVWEILQSSYRDIDGIKGSGFRDKEDMIQNIPMWKIITNDGKVHAVAMYKDKGGRKFIAVGSDGSDYAKKHLTSVIQNELSRSYGEKSKAALGFMMKTVPWPVLEPFLIPASEISKKLGDAVTIVSNMKFGDLPTDGKQTLTKFPKLIKYAYLREIGGTMSFKIAMGTIGKTIK
jgi:hypothetical protein